jgi:hypothetical protein
MRSIPPAIDADAEDVVWALQTADTLWKRNERVDAIVWLRRAAQAAGEAEDDDRALRLARDAAELAEWIAQNPSSARRSGAPLPASEPPAGGDGIDDLLRGPGDGTLDLGNEVEDIPDDAGDVPTPVQDVEVAFSSPPAHAASPSLTPPVAVVRSPIPPPPSTASGHVPTAAEAHAGMLDPWADPEAPTRNHGAPPVALAPVPSAPAEFESDEVVTSAPAYAENPDFIKALQDSTPTLETEPIAPRGPPVHKPGLSAPPGVSPKAAAQPAFAALLGMDPRAIAMPGMDPKAAAQPSVRPKAPAAPTVPSPPRPPRRTGAPPVAPAAPRARPPAAPVHAAPVPALAEAAPVPALTAAAPVVPVIADTIAEATVVARPTQATTQATTGSNGVELSGVEALSDLPDDARIAFAEAATVEVLARDDEASGFALALVLEGSVDVSATIVDAAAQRLEAGAVVRARGTVDHVAPLRLVGATDRSRVATWDEAAVTEAFRTCPWVEDELRVAGDRLQALVGITMGPLGERLDPALRAELASRLTLRALAEHEVIATRGGPSPGLLVVGAGELELLGDDGTPNGSVVKPGEFLFAQEALRAAVAPSTVRAGRGGALVLLAERRVAQELLMTVPPLLEIFAGM